MFFSIVYALMGIFLPTLLSAQESGKQVPFLLSPAQDTVPRWIRDARGKRFNIRSGRSMFESSGDVPPGALPLPPPITIVDYMRQEEMPYADADTIVVGTVTHLQPFLSADGNGIYTEYTLVVTESIKNKASITVLPGYSITLLRPGGTARLANGRVIRHEIRNSVEPVVGQQYLAFLAYEYDFEAFEQLKLWLVKDGLLTPLYPDDRSRRSAGESNYAGKPLPETIFFLKDAANR